MSIQQRRPFAIPQFGRPLRRADKVGEQNGGEHPIGDPLRCRTGDESLDPRREAIDVESVDEDGVARELLVDRTLDQIGELPLRLLRHVCVDGPEHQRRSLHEGEHVGDVARQRQAEEALDLHRGRRRADVAGDLASSDRIPGQRRSPDVENRVGPGHVGNGHGHLVGDLGSGDGAAACRRADGDQPRDPVGMGRGQNRQRPAGLDSAEQERALGFDRVHHRERIFGMGLERQVFLGGVGDAGVAPVESDDAGECPELLEEPRRLGQMPDRLDVRRRGSGEKQVVVALAVDLVGDRDPAARGVARFGNPHDAGFSPDSAGEDLSPRRPRLTDPSGSRSGPGTDAASVPGTPSTPWRPPSAASSGVGLGVDL